LGAVALFVAFPAHAQILKDVLTPTAPVQIAPPPAAKVTNPSGQMLRAGQAISLETAVELTSRSAAMGQMVQMRLAEDVVIDGRVAIPRGAPAMGQVEDVRTKGYLGQRGKLAIRPLYLTHGNQTIRLTGRASSTGEMKTGAVIGIALVSGVFTGKSAVFPSGTKLEGVIVRDVILAP
jgi:hypothetical protein